MNSTLSFLTALLLLASCGTSTAPSTGHIRTADAIYFNGDILTMEGDSANYTEAVVVDSGRIVFVGAKAEALKYQGDSTVMHDLQGKTLLPSFIDPHSHFMSSLAMATYGNYQTARACGGNEV